MERQYDLLVVGTGITSGVASRCREAGWTVAVVDSRPFGGTCALRGCVPKKILVSVAEAVHAARDMAGKGVPAESLTIDWPELMRFKRALVDPTPARTEQTWAKMGIEQFHGRARFVGPATLAVGDDRLTGRRVLIAAGAMPAPLKFPGADRLTTSEQFLNLDRLPASLAFVGGGYISFEFAHVAARAGAEVTILHRGARPLEGFDPDLVDLLLKRSRELGIKVELGVDVLGVDVAGDRLAVRGMQGGQERRFEVDLAVHGAGRVPEIDGDAAASGPPLTPKATHDAEVLTTNLLEGNRRTPKYDGIASACFTLPPIASAGLTEEAARAGGRRFRKTWQDTSGWFNTRRVGETVSAFKVLIEEDTGRILGAHLLGPHAEDVISVFSLAIRLGIPADELKQTLFAYPTNSWDIRFML